jgi:hypothetical protein
MGTSGEFLWTRQCIFGFVKTGKCLMNHSTHYVRLRMCKSCTLFPLAKIYPYLWWEKYNLNSPVSSLIQQNVPFTTHDNHEIYYGTKNKPESDPNTCNALLQPYNFPCDAWVKITLVARPLLKPTAQKLCRWENGVSMSITCIHSKYHLASSSFIPFVKHLVIRILTNTYRIRQQYCDWYQNCGTHDMFCPWQAVIERQKVEIKAVPTSSCASAATRDRAATIKYCHWFRYLVRGGVHV